jgi:hypothetical protein
MDNAALNWTRFFVNLAYLQKVEATKTVLGSKKQLRLLNALLKPTTLSEEEFDILESIAYSAETVALSYKNIATC